jgi:hypothetical protein
MTPPDHGARARLRGWQAARAWIPNRYKSPLHEVESMAEDAGQHLREAAKATGNRSLMATIDAMRLDALERRKR